MSRGTVGSLIIFINTLPVIELTFKSGWLSFGVSSSARCLNNFLFFLSHEVELFLQSVASPKQLGGTFNSAPKVGYFFSSSFSSPSSSPSSSSSSTSFSFPSLSGVSAG